MCSGAIESGRRSVASGYDKKEMVDMIYMPAGHVVRSSALNMSTCTRLIAD